MKGLYPTTIDTLKDVVINGKWDDYKGKITTLGLVSGENPELNYVQIPTATTQFAEGKFTKADYATLVKALFDGTVKVSADITQLPATTNTTVTDQGSIKG